eukprot:g1713.t1
MPKKNGGKRKGGGKKKKTTTTAEVPPTTTTTKTEAEIEEEVSRAFSAMTANAMPTEDVNALKKSNELKEMGKKAFASKKYAEAVKHWTEAIQWTPTSHQIWSNRSAAYTIQGEYTKAIFDAKRCTKLMPNWSKGYLRLGSAQFRLKAYAEAKSTFEKALELDPKSSTAARNLKQVCLALEKVGGSDAADTKTDNEPSTKEEANEEEDDGGVAVGIDLGTTNSCVAVYRNGSVEIIPNEEGKRTTPSVVAFLPDGSRLVGDAAKSQAASNPTNTLYETKRLIGRCFSDSTVQTDAGKLPFRVVGGSDDRPMIEVTNPTKRQYAPEQISALVLSKMKATAEKYLERPVTKAVITVPAYFNDAQRNATKQAGAIAGLKVLRIINEPTAAALAYGLDKSATEEASEAAKKKKRSHVLVFDLGGGTFDVSLLAIEGGIFEVCATGGDTHLGGEDFDDLLSNHLASELRRKFKSEANVLLKSPRVIRRLRKEAEQCKRTLSAATSANVDIELSHGDVDVDFATVVTRAKFERLCSEPFKRCIDTVKRVLKDAKVNVADVDDCVLVGGSTRIPKVQEALRAHFKGKELCQNVNPDEAVAYGAAVQAAILSGTRDSTTSQLLLVDVTPLSLGIETVGRVMSTIIKRNTPIPCEVTKIYTTDFNYQSEIEIPIFEGERASTTGNNKLGEFTVSGIQRAKRGEPQIAVTFKLDADGILKVRAEDKMTGAEARIEIQNKGRLSSSEIDKMVEDAKRYEEEDKARVKQMEVVQRLEDLVYQSEDALLMYKSSGSPAALLTASKKSVDRMSALDDAVKASKMWISRCRQGAGSDGDAEEGLAMTTKIESRLEKALVAFSTGRD